MYSTDPFVALSAFSLTHSGCGVELPEGGAKHGSIGGFYDAEIDQYITQAYAHADPKVISAGLHEAEKILVESAYVVPLVFNQSFAFVSSELSGVTYNGLGNFVFTRVSQKNYREYLY
jgi:ABC-type transport system substrate-binding protein